MNADTTINTTPNKSKCAALVTLRLLPEDKSEAYWISKNYKCSIARIFREALWNISETVAQQSGDRINSDLVSDFDPLKGNSLLEASTATAMFSLRLTEKERADLEALAEMHHCSISSVFRAALRILLPIARKMMKKNRGPNLFQ